MEVKEFYNKKVSLGEIEGYNFEIDSPRLRSLINEWIGNGKEVLEKLIKAIIPDSYQNKLLYQYGDAVTYPIKTTVISNKHKAINLLLSQNCINGAYCIETSNNGVSALFEIDFNNAQKSDASITLKKKTTTNALNASVVTQRFSSEIADIEFEKDEYSYRIKISNPEAKDSFYHIPKETEFIESLGKLETPVKISDIYDLLAQCLESGDNFPLIKIIKSKVIKNPNLNTKNNDNILTVVYANGKITQFSACVPHNNTIVKVNETQAPKIITDETGVYSIEDMRELAESSCDFARRLCQPKDNN